jgi:hypothetical protein
MTISLTCACGVHLEVDETFAGQTISCPDCQRSLTAPRPEQAGLQTSGFALASLTLALVGAFTVIGSLAAVVCGLLALQRIARTPEKVTGKGYAVTGILLGGVLTAFTVVALIVPELFGLSRMLSPWAGKLDYSGPDEIVRLTERFAIKKPSPRWGVYRPTANQALPGDPPVWDYLLLVNLEEDAHLLVEAQRVPATWDLERCREQAYTDFRDHDKAKIFGGKASSRRARTDPPVQIKRFEGPGQSDGVEMQFDKSMAGQDRRFIMQVIKEREDPEGVAFVLVGGARKGHFARVEPEIRKALESFRIEVRRQP